MEEKNGFFNKVSNDGRTNREEDFDEEDVWGSVMEKTDISPNLRNSKDSTPKCLTTDSRMASRDKSSTHEVMGLQQSSSPVNIPDWSKIYSYKNSNKGCGSHAFKDDSMIDDGHGDVVNNDDVGNDDDDDDDDMVPPHEWIAKKLASSQISSFSVCEGVGRTLKGRDLSKVRNVVLSRTGFLE